MSHMHRLVSCIGLAIFLSVSAVTAWAADADCSGHRSPESVYRAANQAIEQDRWAKLRACYHPDHRDRALGRYLFSVLVSADFRELHDKRQRLDAVMKRHGFQINEHGSYVDFYGDVAKVADWAGLLKEVARVARQMANGDLFATDARLEELSIQGDTATAKAVYTRDGQRASHSVRFQRAPEGWYLAGERLGDEPGGSTMRE